MSFFATTTENKSPFGTPAENRSPSIFNSQPMQPQFLFSQPNSVGSTPLLPTTVATSSTKKDVSAKFVNGPLSEDVLEYCKCNYCNGYVSVGPVRMIDNKIACGRCRYDTEGVRLMVVEALAKQFHFPCRYKTFGCQALLKWVLVDSHEKVCDFKEIRCSVAECNWIGAKSSLRLHFEQKHSQEIIHSQRGIAINLEEKNTSNFLYVSKHKTFLVLLSNTGDNIYHEVKFFCTSLEACMYVYDICLYNSEKKLLFLNQKLQSFDDDVGISNAELSIDVLKSVFTNSNVKISFQIKYSNTEAVTFSVQNIECPVCFEPMLSNIIIGNCGHSVCEQCKKSLQNCPCCRSKFFTNVPGITVPSANQEIRNYSLEALVKKLSLDV